MNFAAAFWPSITTVTRATPPVACTWPKLRQSITNRAKLASTESIHVRSTPIYDVRPRLKSRLVTWAVRHVAYALKTCRDDHHRSHEVSDLKRH